MSSKGSVSIHKRVFLKIKIKYSIHTKYSTGQNPYSPKFYPNTRKLSKTSKHAQSNATKIMKAGRGEAESVSTERFIRPVRIFACKRM